MTKSALVTAFPHLSLLLLVLMYIFFGACILSEVELTASKSFSTTQPNKPTHLNKFSERDHLLRRIKEDCSLEKRFNDLLAENSLKTESSKSPFQFDPHVFQYLSRRLNKPPPSQVARNKQLLKKKAKLTVKDIIRLASLYMTSYKAQLNLNMTKVLVKFVAEYKQIQTKVIKSVLDEVGIENESREQSLQTADSTKPKRFPSLLFFLFTQLSSLGYQQIRIETEYGKLFMMAYLLFGIPLTQILLIDICHVFVYIVRLGAAFYDTLTKSNNLYDNLTHRIRKSIINSADLIRTPLKNITGKSGSRVRKNLAQKYSSYSIQDILYQTYELAVEQVNSSEKLGLATFSTPVLVFLFIMFILFGCVLFDFDSDTAASTQLTVYVTQFYSVFNVLTQISIRSGPFDASSEETLSSFYLISYKFYLLIGISLTFMGLKVLRERLRLCVVNNFKWVFTELLKFNKHFDTTTAVPEIYINDQAPLSEDLTAYLDSIGREERVDLIVRAAETENRENQVKRMSKSSSYYRFSSDKFSLSSNISGPTEPDTSDKQTQVTTILCSKYFTTDDFTFGGGGDMNFSNTSSNVKCSDSSAVLEKRFESKACGTNRICYDMHSQTEMTNTLPDTKERSTPENHDPGGGVKESVTGTNGNKKIRTNLNLTILRTSTPNSISIQTNGCSPAAPRRSRFEKGN